MRRAASTEPHKHAIITFIRRIRSVHVAKLSVVSSLSTDVLILARNVHSTSYSRSYLKHGRYLPNVTAHGQVQRWPNSGSEGMRWGREQMLVP